MRARTDMNAEATKSMTKSNSRGRMTPRYGPSAVDRVVAVPKYPVPSPRREAGMMLWIAVMIAVFPAPKAIPWTMRSVSSRVRSPAKI